jgi:heat shock protein HslJ
MSVLGRLAGLVLVVVSIGACASAQSPSDAPSASPSVSTSSAPGGGLSGPTWIVTTIGGSDTIADARPTIVFGTDGEIQGSGSCNSYSGPYRLDGNTIEVGELMSTMMLCANESIGAQETAFMAALGGAQTWHIDQSGELVLGGASEIVARAGASQPSGSSAVGGGIVGSWDLAEMGPTADFAHLQPTLEFSADGRMSGFAGCNTFSGSYTTNGAAVTFGPLATTEMACQRPGSAVEAEYLAALGSVTGWAVEPDGRLRLDGGVPLRFAPG